jgi:hypothetical protein
MPPDTCRSATPTALKPPLPGRAGVNVGEQHGQRLAITDLRAVEVVAFAALVLRFSCVSSGSGSGSGSGGRCRPPGLRAARRSWRHRGEPVEMRDASDEFQGRHPGP